MDLSTVTKEQIKKIDVNTAYRYRVIKEKIDLQALRQEKADLEQQIATKPSKEELLEYAKASHPFYGQKENNQERIAKIDTILSEIK